MELHEYSSVIEALLFSADQPVSASKLRGCIETDEEIPVEEIIDQLNDYYDQEERAFFIMGLAGGYQLVTRKEYEPYVKKLYVSASRMRLSQAALEALAVIAYKQPVSRPEIDDIRGVNSDSVVRTLLERDLITVKGRADQPGRPLLYGTSDEFLRYFGLNSLDDLPKLKEIDEIMVASEEMEAIESEISTQTESSDTPGETE